jgi:predicted HicB family RNase H-like nuclease
VKDGDKPRTTFPLRLAASLRERAEKFAALDGVSINHFINLAVAEKISRLESVRLAPDRKDL